VVSELAPAFGPDLVLVDPPRLTGPDTPEPADLPAFSVHLARALEAILEADPRPPAPGQLDPFTWHAVFTRIARIWDRLAPPARSR
jgi:hypothetical protein